MTLRGPPSERSPAELLEFGVINLDKPPGPSAHQVAAWVRDLCEVEQAAHAGTLDPKVTGCLPTLTGSATRLSQVFLEGSKEYVSVLELHETAPADIEAIVSEFEAPLYQKPPRKSAVSRKLRVREIYELDVLEVQDRKALLGIRCESGTYIRKLCHDIGLALGTGAHMGHLRRTATDPFDDTDLVALHDLSDALARWREEDEDDWLRKIVRPAEDALTHLPSVTIAPSAAEQVAHGAQVYAPGVIEAEEAERDQLVACHTPNGAAVCLGRMVGDADADEGTVVELERVLV
ncbi:H/ACA RNA-protein complex component Cbf5p [Haladaptatus paucihalophilus DX253]|uniref:Probable tRNA pseudouridine synthase B n=1 Tax=Haladaptatus paucihalophilus DX253 TaxID=797209 RepID=E7QZR0_HALPU|nr:RNA-guided pseudouridylation complex pseudouridine synthase subunit Cbf5 [Haladaptatus paucihalophilus]EFW89804.1 H/ACA RNA-protein complex component Cbf5p [Haladaptatus paucihalophilus DX253]SHK54879.1 tRNA pseudouridine synthase B [Haladaptatus paucihalophilus DX253]